MFTTLNKIFKRFQKTPVIVENFNSNGYSDILIICAKENIPLYGFDGENLEKEWNNGLKPIVAKSSVGSQIMLELTKLQVTKNEVRL